MNKIIALTLFFLAPYANAFITVNEGLPTTKDAVYVGTTTPQVLLNGGTFYAGLVPSVSLYVASNTVLGNCVAYSTGSITCLGVRLSTTDPAGTYVPYSGATADVNIGAHGVSAASGTFTNGITASSGTFTQTGTNYSLSLSSGADVKQGDLNVPNGCAILKNGITCGGGTGAIAIAAVSDNFLGLVDGSKTSFTLSQTPTSPQALRCHLDGLLLSPTSDYVFTPPVSIVITTAPASNSTEFECDYFVNTSTLPGVFILTQDENVSGNTTMAGKLTVSASSGASISYGLTTATMTATGWASIGGSSVPAAGLSLVTTGYPVVLSAQSTAARGALNANDGALFYNTTTKRYSYFNTQDNAWVEFSTSSASGGGGVVKSSGSTVYFSSSFNFNSSQTSFNDTAVVTGSTISFTVQGTTVACWLVGTAKNSLVNQLIIMGVAVDGNRSAISGTSSTVGEVAVFDGIATAYVNVSFGPIEFQVTGGGTSHSFFLGLWTDGGTAQFMPSSDGAHAIGAFTCREVLSQ